MSDYHVVSYEQEPENKNTPKIWQKILLTIGVIFFLTALSAFSYYLGTKENEKTSAESETPTPTQTITLPTLPPVATPTPSATPTVKGAKTTPTPIPQPKTKKIILDSIGTLSGFRSSNGGGNNTEEIRVGKNNIAVTRGFVSFDLSELPNSAKIKSAAIRLYQTQVDGNPYQIAGSIKIDHLTFGNSLDEDDYTLAALTSNLATLANNKTLEWKEANVTEAVKDDIANARSKSQFRFHFIDETKGENAEGDFAYFDSANNYEENSGHLPELVIEYN